MKKVFLLIFTIAILNLSVNAQFADFRPDMMKTMKTKFEPKLPKVNNKPLSIRAATSIDTFFVSHAYYTNCYAAEFTTLRSFGNIYTALGATNQIMQGVTDYVHPNSDGQFNEIFTIFDTLYSAGFNTAASRFVRKAFIIDSSVSVKIDTVTLRCGLSVADTAKRNFAGDSIIMSLYSVDKTSKARLALLKKVFFTGQSDLDSFYNDGFIYMANFPFNNYTLPAGVNAIGFLVEYKTKHMDSNVLLVSYNYLDSCQNVVVGGQSFRSPAHRPLFSGYTTWNVIDSTSPTAATTIAQNSGFSYSATAIPAPLNCRFVYNQNFYIFPTVIVESKFYGSLATSPNKSSFCANSDVTISPDVKGGKEPFTYKWTATSGTIDNDTDPAIILSLGTSSSNVKVVVKDANGDTIVLTRTINISSPSVSVAASKTVLTTCTDIANLTASGAGNVSYSWSNGKTTALNAVSVAGTYTVTATNAFGCTVASTPTVITSSVTPYVIPDFTVSAAPFCVNKDLDYVLTSPATGYTFTWKSGATTLGTGDGIQYKFTTSGAKSITVSGVEDATSCVATPRVKSVTILPSTDNACKTNGIENSIKNNFSIYPNPIKDGVLNVKNDLSQSVNIRITNIIGTTVMQENISNTKLNTLDVSNLNNGVYFVEIESKNEREILKIIIDKQ